MEKQIDYSEHICSELGCYNSPEKGYILCSRCLRGSSHKASADAIKWKVEREHKGELTLPWMNKIRVMRAMGISDADIINNMISHGLDEEARIEESFKEKKVE